MRRPRRIAVAFSVGVPHFERILRGMVDYARQRELSWHFDFNPETGEVPIESLARWKGDGIVGLITTAAGERRAAALGVPVVNVSSAPLRPRLPAVTADNRAVGDLAAKHLLERGFRRFAYYGLDDAGFGVERGAGFAATLASAGFACKLFYDRVGDDAHPAWHLDRRRLARWIATLEPPVGLLATHDYRARMVIDACAEVGLRVPHDVAVVGVDNDAVACELSDPPLTSVPLPGQEIGLRAAALLDRMMRGQRVPATPIRIPPPALVARGSTDVLAVADETTAAAVRMMLDRLDRPFSIKEVAGRIGMSRRSLEQRFRRWLGTTPHEYISRLRIGRARQLLLLPSRPKLREVARRCGFSDPRSLNLTFERLEGCTPRHFRERHRRAGA